MASYGDTSFEIRISLQKEQVDPVHFWCNRIHNGLTVGRAVVEKHIQDGIIDEVT